MSVAEPWQYPQNPDPLKWSAFAARVLAGAAGDGAEPDEDRSGVRGLIPAVEPFARAAADTARQEIGRRATESAAEPVATRSWTPTL